MSLIKFYKYIIWGLVGLNITILAFFLLTKPNLQHRPPFKNARSEVIKMLDLNSQQASQLNILADQHKHKLIEIIERQKKLLSSYFESLFDSTENTDKDNIINEYQQLEEKKIEMTYQHFQKIKGLLEKNQLTDFKTFVETTTDKFLLGQKKSPPPKDID